MIFNLLRVGKIVDGDTVHLWLHKSAPLMPGWTTITHSDEAVKCRLAWLDTPERGEVGWAEARADIVNWFTDREHPSVEVEWFLTDSFGRWVVDIRSVESESLSQWMMQRGWEPWAG